MHERRAIGSVVAGKFRIEAELGEGTGGVVYRAVQEPLSRAVALKVLVDEKAGASTRFEREARAVARLKHDNVVVLYDFGDAGDGVPYLAMELVEGCTLRALLDRRELLVDEARGVALGIARALAHAHAAGVMHRDLKPENVMLEGERAEAAAVRVVDFGLAHVARVDGASATVTSTIAGTPAYMAPERAEPNNSARAAAAAPAPADAYALGVLLYEMLTGANPFRAESTWKTLARHVDGPVPPPPSTLRPDAAPFDALVTALLAKDPAARPPLAAVVDALAAPAGAPTHAPLPPSSSPRRALAVVAAAVAVAAALAVVVTLVPQRGRDDDNVAAARNDDAVMLRPPGVAARDEALPDEALPDEAPRDEAPRDQALRVARVRGQGTTRETGVHTRSEREGTVGVAAPAAQERPASALARQAEALRASCAAPCAQDVAAALPQAVAGGLASLKQWKADLETCRVVCKKPRR